MFRNIPFVSQLACEIEYPANASDTSPDTIPITEISTYSSDEQYLCNRTTQHPNSLDSSNKSSVSDITGSSICSGHDLKISKQIILKEFKDDVDQSEKDNDTANDSSVDVLQDSLMAIEHYFVHGNRGRMDLDTKRSVPKIHDDDLFAIDFDDFFPNDSVDLTLRRWSSHCSRHNRRGESARRISQEEALSDLCDIMGNDAFLFQDDSDEE
ncbi:hypothetical protein ACHAXS_000942 [Conticribra weissflogii]